MAIEDELMLDRPLKEWTDAVMERRHALGSAQVRPRYFFRYFSPDSPFTLTNLRDILVGSRMRYSSRTEFNDPLDSRCEYLIPKDQTRAHEFFRQVAMRRSDTPEQAQAFATQQMASPDWHDRLNASLERTVAHAGISCFTERGDSMLMWSHYGGGHSGAAVVFRDLADRDAFLFTMPVAYGNVRPRFQFEVAFNNEGLIRALHYKSSEWSYEFEWRTVAVDMAGQHRALRPDVVCGVIFGCNAHPDFIRTVSALIREREAAGLGAVDTHAMRLKADEFALERERIELLDA